MPPRQFMPGHVAARGIAGASAIALLCLGLSTSPSAAAETFRVAPEDYRVDTAMAIYFEEPDGKPKPYLFSFSGELTQMLMCKGTFNSQLSRIMQALRSRPEYKHRKVVGAACVRSKTKPIALNP